MHNLIEPNESLQHAKDSWGGNRRLLGAYENSRLAVFKVLHLGRRECTDKAVVGQLVKPQRKHCDTTGHLTAPCRK